MPAILLQLLPLIAGLGGQFAAPQLLKALLARFGGRAAGRGLGGALLAPAASQAAKTAAAAGKGVPLRSGVNLATGLGGFIGGGALAGAALDDGGQENRPSIAAVDSVLGRQPHFEAENQRALDQLMTRSQITSALQELGIDPTQLFDLIQTSRGGLV
jgi:hypothetical protein